VHSHNQRNLFALRTIRSNWQSSMTQIWYEYFENIACWYAYIHTYTYIAVLALIYVYVFKIRLCYIVMSCASHCSVDFFETPLGCNCFQSFFFFVEFIPLCYVYIALNMNKCKSTSICNNGFQAITTRLTTVRFWNCCRFLGWQEVSEKCAESIFRVTEVGACRRWIIPAGNSVM